MAPARVLPQTLQRLWGSWEDRWCLSPPPGIYSITSSPQHAGDPTHPTHSFFSLLPSGRRLRSLQARTNRLKDSFIHQAVRKLNSLLSLPPLPSFTPRNTELWHYKPPPPLPPSPFPPYKLWPAPVTLCSTGLISTSSSIVCKLPLLTVW